MRLLTHNMMQCQAKGCDTNNYPLELEVGQVKTNETEFNMDLMLNLVHKVDFTVLSLVCDKLGLEKIPQEVSDEEMENEDFLKTLHHILMNVIIKEGKMICNNCKHIYPIVDGIPNMLLIEDQV